MILVMYMFNMAVLNKKTISDDDKQVFNAAHITEIND